MHVLELPLPHLHHAHPGRRLAMRVLSLGHDGGGASISGWVVTTMRVPTGSLSSLALSCTDASPKGV